MYQTDVVLVLAVVLITITSYNFGKIMAFQSLKTPIKISELNLPQDIVRHTIGDSGTPKPETTPKDQTVVASKKSNPKLYHFTWCPGASKIAIRNKVTFINEATAIAAGYTLAGNCRP